MTSRRPVRALLVCIVLAGVGTLFYRVIWTPLYRERETASFVGSQNAEALQVDVVKDDGKQSKSWTIADQQAISKLRAGLQSAQSAPAEAPAASSDEKYRLRIRRADSRVDEYEVVLGAEGRMHDRVYMVRRSGATPVYGTTFNAPELRSALQQVLVPAAAK